MAFRMETVPDRVVKIKVIGVGGGGNNVIKRMIKGTVQDIDYVAINTDKQALEATNAPLKIQIGEKLTHGQGAGSDPGIGKKSAEESHAQILKSLEGADMAFITAGMGGGTGTGAAPIVAEIARNEGILTVGVVTKPFEFEGPSRMQKAEKGIAELRDKVDALVIIPNERLKLVSSQKITLANAFEIADNVLIEAVQGISDLINSTGYINLDFADVSAVMKNAGLAHMGVGRAAGKGKAEDAARMAITSPLLETSIHAAHGILINITSSKDIGLDEVERAATFVREFVHPTANIIFGAVFDEAMEDELHVTVIATGLEEQTNEAHPRSMIPDAQERPSGQTMARTAAVGSKGAASHTAMPELNDTLSSESPLPVGPNTRHSHTGTVPKQDVSVQRQDAAQATAEHISTKAAFDKMLDEMQNNTFKTSALSFQASEPTGKSLAEPIGRSMVHADALHSATGKSPVRESSAYDKNSMEFQSTPDRFDDPLEAILRIFHDREK